MSEAEEPDGYHPHETTTFDPLFLNATVEDDDDFLVSEFNTTEHKGFLHGFVESLSVILVSELGDKTFFIAAILAMRNNKLTVFLVRVENKMQNFSRLPKSFISTLIVSVNLRYLRKNTSIHLKNYIL